MTMRRIAIIAAVLTILVGIDGIFMTVTNYHPDDASSNSFHFTDGTTVLIAAGILLVVTIIAFALSARTRPTETGVQQEVGPEVKS